MTQERNYPGPNGPMNLGEGYRWNFPVITYACDPEFKNYFGSNGVVAVEQAFKIMNDLPAASDIDVTQFPQYTTRYNYRAGSLLLVDLKSTILSLVLNHVGVTTPTRYVFCLRNEWHDTAGNPNYIVIMRNFDPITYEPSRYVNGTLFTYTLNHVESPHFCSTVMVPVDPLARNYRTASTLALSSGAFLTGLTRDDAGAIKYLYNKNRAVVETVGSNNVTAPSGFSFVTSSGGNNNSWYIPNVGTNTTDTGSATVWSIVGTASGWFSVNITNATTTNTTTTGTTTGTTTDTTTTVTNSFVDSALRLGVNKLVFFKSDFDSVLGQYIAVTNQFIDTFITNGTRVTQVLERAMTSPDILISCGDLGLINNFPVVIGESSEGGWLNNGLAQYPNNTPPISSGGSVDGPGVIVSPQNIYLSKLGPNYVNGPGFLNEADASPGSVFMWGSYDGSTNDPVAFPSGMSLKALEAQVFGY